MAETVRRESFTADELLSEMAHIVVLVADRKELDDTIVNDAKRLYSRWYKMIAPSKNTDGRCANCQYWGYGAKLSSELERENAFGKCHRFPPVLINPSALSHTNAQDWCGEWKAKS